MTYGNKSESPAVIGIIGAGWRADYYHRIVAAVPGVARVDSVLVRTDASVERVETAWPVRATTRIGEFLDRGPYDYVVVAVPPAVAAEMMRAVAEAGLAMLVETPPAADPAALAAVYTEFSDARVQVAEQYALQPQLAARIALTRSGVLGSVHTAQVSVAHGYHGVSLIRSALGAGFGPVELTGRRVGDRVLSVRGRDGWKESPSSTENTRTTAVLDFDAATGIYDFGFEQYFSPIRARHMEVLGSLGELRDDDFRYVDESGRPGSGRLVREATGIDGDLEGFSLHHIAWGTQTLFDSPVPGARLNDDEIAVAAVMMNMTEYARGGAGRYSLADGCHDAYLAHLIGEAAATGERVSSEPQPWSGAVSDLTSATHQRSS